MFGTTLLPLALGALPTLVLGALPQTCLVVAWTGTPVLAIVQSPRPGPTAAA